MKHFTFCSFILICILSRFHCGTYPPKPFMSLRNVINTYTRYTATLHAPRLESVILHNAILQDSGYRSYPFLVCRFFMLGEDKVNCLLSSWKRCEPQRATVVMLNSRQQTPMNEKRKTCYCSPTTMGILASLAMITCYRRGCANEETSLFATILVLAFPISPPSFPPSLSALVVPVWQSP